jgi:hypothetical protein
MEGSERQKENLESEHFDSGILTHISGPRAAMMEIILEQYC